MAVAGTVSAAPRPAQACTCAGLDLLAPTEGQADVPPNAKLWLRGNGMSKDSEFQLIGPEGNVPVAVRSLGSNPWNTHVMLSPAHELSPGASYELWSCPPSAQVQQDCQRRIRFSVGAGRAEKPPVPIERKRSSHYDDGPRGTCGPSASRFVHFEFDWQGLLLLADVGGTNPYPAMPEAMLHLATTEQRYARAGSFTIGSGACLANWWRGGDSAEVRFGAVNIAGEFSGWGEATPVSLPSDGCQLGGGPGALAPWTAGALAIGLLLWRRRRRTL